MIASRSAILFGKIGRGVLWRAPILLLTVGALTLFLAMPYRCLDADVTTFGLMGNDLLRHGYLPTLAYGQNYLFSITPYLYALIRLLVPSLSATPALVTAGSILSLGGLWLVYEGLLTTEDNTGRRRVWPLIVFCLLVGGSWTYLFDISRFSSIELSLFLLGIVTFAAARAERNLAAAVSSPWPWGMLGVAFGHALCSRPQIAIYAALAVALLLARLRRGSPRALSPTLVALAAGAFVGYLPMLLHNLLRAADWPFRHHIHLKLGHPQEMLGACVCFFTEIGPRIFLIGSDHLLYSLLVLIWIAVAIALFVVAARHGGDAVSALDRLWAIGSLIVVLMMIVVPRLSDGAETRRYCLHIFLGVVWLFARFGAAPGLRRRVLTLLLAGLILLAIPQWRQQIDEAGKIDRRVREAQTAFIPYLKGLNAPIMTQYWDAYLLAFLADGTLKIEAYPWDLVRTYGLWQEDEMRRRTIWLVKSGFGTSTRDQLAQELGPDALERLHRQDTPLTLLGRECELWEFDTGKEAVALMKKYHPRYFSTPYPPARRSQTDGR